MGIAAAGFSSFQFAPWLPTIHARSREMVCASSLWLSAPWCIRAAVTMTLSRGVQVSFGLIATAGKPVGLWLPGPLG